MTTQFFSGCDFLSRNGMVWGTGSLTVRAASAPSEDSDTVAPCARHSTLAPGKKILMRSTQTALKIIIDVCTYVPVGASLPASILSTTWSG